MLCRNVSKHQSTPRNIPGERRSQTFCSLHLVFMYGGFLHVTATWQHVSRRFRVMMCIRCCTSREGNYYKIVLKSGSLNLLEHAGPVQACNGIALPLTIYVNTLRTGDADLRF